MKKQIAFGAVRGDVTLTRNPNKTTKFSDYLDGSYDHKATVNMNGIPRSYVALRKISVFEKIVDGLLNYY